MKEGGTGWERSKKTSSSSSSSAFPAMLDLQSGEYGKSAVCQCLNWFPKLPVGIHQTGPCLASQSIEGEAGLQDVVGGLRTCAAWTFVWMGHFQSVEAGEELTVPSFQSIDCVTWAALSRWWMLASSVPMSRRCRHSVLKLFLSIVFASLWDCSNLLPIFDSRSASSLPPTPQWEGIHWKVTDVLFLSRDSSCLMLLKIPPLLVIEDSAGWTGSQSNTLC